MRKLRTKNVRENWDRGRGGERGGEKGGGGGGGGGGRPKRRYMNKRR